MSALRINLGCGSSPTPGYLNFDNSPTVRLARLPLARFMPGRSTFVSRVREDNIRFGKASRIPVPDHAADVLYSSHMLEHLDRSEAVAFLAEAKRVLKPGGVLRIAVPDLKILVEDYKRVGDADGFMLWMHTCEPKPKGIRKLRYLLDGFRHHHWMYDSKSLCRLLSGAGFREPRSLPAGETAIPDPGELDLRERQNESLYVEAVA